MPLFSIFLSKHVIFFHIEEKYCSVPRIRKFAGQNLFISLQLPQRAEIAHETLSFGLAAGYFQQVFSLMPHHFSHKFTLENPTCKIIFSMFYLKQIIQIM